MISLWESAMSLIRAALVLFLCAGCAAACAQEGSAPPPPASLQNIVEIDASAPIPPPESGYLHLGGTSATGHDLEINSQYLTLDGKPMLPVMGEFHFSRYPPQEWEEEILKMKAAGVNIISTYIFWIHHEEIEGQFDWSGQRDLRRFVQLCAKHGMYVYLRIGPWDHGEVRNGGLPDWLLKNTAIKPRSNDPAYLALVTRFDDQIAAQVKGLLWKDGGPVVGVQLENEYGSHGPGKGAEHILKLKQLAIAAGLDVPLYSVTGWPSLDFPPHDVFPVSGGYPDGFWFGSLNNLPPSMTYLFNLNRKLGDMGAIAPANRPAGTVDMRHYPFFGAEEAGGMELSYLRRPLMQSDDIAALTLTGLGSGVNLYGYYMFHGGANPPGKLSTLQESLATAYPNDLPEISYDFQAPLGEYGQVRESYRKIKMLHLFLNRFGNELAPMAAFGPEHTLNKPGDNATPRVSVRAAGDRAFIFVNNYVRQLAMPARDGFQVQVKLATSQMSVPEQPITVPANTYFCWPVNLQLDGVQLRYSTAQLLTRIDSANESTFVFFTIPGIAPEFSFAKDGVQSLQTPGLSVVRSGSAIRVKATQAAVESEFQIVSVTGRRIRVLLLPLAEAESANVVQVDGADHLLLSPANVFMDGARLHLRSVERHSLSFKVFPALTAASTPGVARSVAKSGIWTDYTFSRPEIAVDWKWKKIRDAQPLPPVRMGPQSNPRKAAKLEVPSDEAFSAAAEWKLTLGKPLPEGVSNLWLTLDYTGDIGRMYIGDRLVDDNFFYGAPWQIGLKRFLPEALSSGMRLQVLPLRQDAPIYLDPSVRAALPKLPQVANVNSITVQPEYEVITLLGSPAK
jgi:beta-galactosidase